MGKAPPPRVAKALSRLKEGVAIQRFGSRVVQRRGLLYEIRPAEKKQRLDIPQSLVHKVNQGIAVEYDEAYGNRKAPQPPPLYNKEHVVDDE